MYNVPAMVRDPRLFPIFGQSFASSDDSPLVTSAKIKLTEGCNLRCVMCKYWRSTPEDELTRDEVLRAIDGMREMGLRKVHFSGGELFLRPDAVEILCATAARGINVNLTTNGTLLTHETAKELVRGGIHSMSFSLDGPDAATHDRIRGQKGAFKATLRGIERMSAARRRRGARLYLRINTVLQKRNYQRHADMIDLAARLGACELRPMPVDETPKVLKRVAPVAGAPAAKPRARKLALSEEQIREYNDVIAPEVAARRAAHGFSTDSDYVYPFGTTAEEIALSARGEYARGFYRDNVCFAPWLHTFIDWHGDVFLCCMTRSRLASLGNIRQQSFGEIFDGAPYREIRRRFRAGRLAVCHQCDDFRSENRLLNGALVHGAGERNA